MILYRSVFGYGEAEYIIEKSRFIARVSPAESPEEARRFIAEVKEKYRDATHNVPAFICGAGSEHQWASDDGEPQGTSGMPVLKLISSEGLTNTVVVITRYFGGIKLGTGGLARAYTHSAKLGIESAGICDVKESALLKYSFGYTHIGKIRNLVAEKGLTLEDEAYTDTVSAVISCPKEDAGILKSAVSDLTAGRAVLVSETAVLGRYLVEK